MKLRELSKKDAVYMLEWIKDNNVNYWFRFDAAASTLESTMKYIEDNYSSIENKHYAIVNEEDEYIGTISLKNIDKINLNAEYAIALRTCGIGKGIAQFATNEILRIAFYELKLHRVYLCVRSDNERAIKFYTKMGFILEGEFKAHINIKETYYNLKWYAIVKENK